MDLNDFNFRESQAARMVLTNPVTEAELLGDDQKPVWIDLHGSDSPLFRRATRAYGNKKLQKQKQKQTIEEIEEVASRILAASTVAWSDNFVVNGERLECTPEKAEWLYTEFTWVREQVDAFVNERANFLASA